MTYGNPLMFSLPCLSLWLSPLSLSLISLLCLSSSSLSFISHPCLSPSLSLLSVIGERHRGSDRGETMERDRGQRQRKETWGEEQAETRNSETYERSIRDSTIFALSVPHLYTAYTTIPLYHYIADTAIKNSIAI